jgi:hypothetical protein
MGALPALLALACPAVFMLRMARLGPAFRRGS